MTSGNTLPKKVKHTYLYGQLSKVVNLFENIKHNHHHRSKTHRHTNIFEAMLTTKILTPFCPVKTSSEVSALMLLNNFQRNFSVYFAIAFPPREVLFWRYFSNADNSISSLR